MSSSSVSSANNLQQNVYTDLFPVTCVLDEFRRLCIVGVPQGHGLPYGYPNGHFPNNNGNGFNYGFKFPRVPTGNGNGGIGVNGGGGFGGNGGSFERNGGSFGGNGGGSLNGQNISEFLCGPEYVKWCQKKRL